MDVMSGRAARRELAFVLALAVSGIAVVLVVAFAPWYQPEAAGQVGAGIVPSAAPVGARQASAIRR
jgi:hypothetical protein